MQKIRRIAAVGCLLCWMALCLMTASAAGEQPVWASVQGMDLYVYLPSQEAVTRVQVGNTACTSFQSTPVTQLDMPVEPVVLLDISISISQEDRSLIQQILDHLIGNRLPGEVFTIATMDTEIHYLCQKEGDYLTLQGLIEGIQHNDQDTRLTDGLYQLLDDLQASDDGTLRRMVLICDGVDNKKLSYTHEEIVRKIQQAGYPLYAIGCTNRKANGNELIENLFGLSRLTQGKTVYLGDIRDPLQIAGIIDEYNTAQRLVVSLPEEVCDGSSRGVQVIQQSGKTWSMQMDMPFAQPAEPQPEQPAVSSEPATSAPEPEPEPQQQAGGLNPLLAVIPLVLVAAGVAAALLTGKKRARKKAAQQQDDRTQWVGQDSGEATVPVDQAGEDSDATAAVWKGGRGQASVLLVDCANSLHRYEVPLQGTISVGRAPDCRVVLDYDRTVGRHQCDLYQENGELYVRNISQTNPTLLNGCAVTGPQPVASGSTLRLGNVELRVDLLYGSAT